ncbi:MAG TPA: methyltransferase, partial [Blastocatellia bacterium]|nr:methyltransferase [Blastocatellia bacterium]
YYGRLIQGKKGASRETLLHDYAQLISGQGVPPASAAEWHSIYKRAECRLLHIIEDKATSRFVHIIRL